MAKGNDSDLVNRVVAAIYFPWLDSTARKFQELVVANAGGFRNLVKMVDAELEREKNGK